MMRTTLEDLFEDSLEARGDIERLFLHWSAGNYEQYFDDYHIAITGAGEIYKNSAPLTATLAHTWQHNTGAVGICLCCAKGATPTDFGQFPPTEIQIDVLCRVCAVLLEGLGLLLSFATVRTHAEQADLDDYGPSTTCERWDLWMLHEEDMPGSGGKELRQRTANYMI